LKVENGKLKDEFLHDSFKSIINVQRLLPSFLIFNYPFSIFNVFAINYRID